MAKKKGRRDYGDGSISQRPDGRWQGQINLGRYFDEKAGKWKRKRLTVYGDTEKEVREKLQKHQGEKLSGSLVEPSKVTLGAYLIDWLEKVVKGSRRANTLRSYRGIVNRILVPRLGSIPLTRLVALQVQDLYTWMRGAGYSVRMQELSHAILHRALEQAIKWNMLRFNACDGAVRPRPPKTTRPVWNLEQIDTFLKAAATSRYEALFVLAIFGGFRQGELFALAWEDIDLDAGVVNVKHSLEEINATLQLKEPKSAKGRRSVTLPQVAVDALVRHKARAMAKGRLHCPVFCNRKGGYLYKSNFKKAHYFPLLKRAGLPRIRFHDLRHCHATLLLSQGVHPKVVQERLGHSQISITLDCYSHVIPSLQKDVATKLDSLFPKSQAAKDQGGEAQKTG
jgi:integrase